MTPAQVIDRVRYNTKTSATDGTAADTDLLPILNDYVYRFETILIGLNDDKYGKKATTALNTQANQEAYAMPSDLVKLKRVEITYDGTNWRKVDMNDDSEVQEHALDATTINQRYTQNAPKGDMFGDSIYLRPIPTSAQAAGLRIWYIARPSLLSTMSSTIQIPDEYHGYLVYGVTAEVATRQGNDSLAAAMFQKWEDGRVKAEKNFAPRSQDHLFGFRPMPVNYG